MRKGFAAKSLLPQFECVIATGNGAIPAITRAANEESEGNF
jgi:hypothetical protein